MKKYTSTKLACYVGYVVQAIINNFLPILFIVLNKNYGLNYEMLGRIILVNFGVQFLTDALTPKIVALFGYRKCMVISQWGAAAGLCLLAILPQIMSNVYLAINISVVIYAVGSGLLEVLVSPLIENLPTDNKKANMSFLHSFYCWGQVFTVILTTLMVRVFGFANWQFIPLVWAIIPFFNGFAFIKVPFIEPISGDKSEPIKNLIKNKTFIGIMIMMFCAGASEIAMAEWASMFAQEGLGVSKVIGDLAGPCAFAVLMGTGRITHAAIAEKIPFKTVLITMSIACIICYIITGGSASPVISLIFCAICGFTVSSFWPGLYSQASSSFPLGGTAMFSIFALCGDLGCSIGPWLLGVIADATNLATGFLCCTVFPAVMMITALCVLPSQKRELQK